MESRELLIMHCCFNTDNIFLPTPRIHVPLATMCSMGCSYCGYSYDGNISSSQLRPGVVNNVVSSYDEIYEYLCKALIKLPEAEIIGVSGPGDPLENYNQLSFLMEIIKEKWPTKTLCLCTNGRFFFPCGKAVVDSGLLKYITFTINTLDENKLPQIYNSFREGGATKCAEHVKNLISAIRYCKLRGVTVKVNTVFLSGINDDDIEDMFEKLKNIGVDCFNLLPQRGMNDVAYDSTIVYSQKRNELQSKGFPLTRHCKMCRADFCGE